MKIFISHTSTDKAVVGPIAEALSGIFGKGSVFYDSWSIRPGDGIIDRMNFGLEECDFFFLFISKRSLTSEMVKMEWQNALMARGKQGMTFVPVLIEDCEVPAIIRQIKYINLWQVGTEVALRQMVDVIQGGDGYRGEDSFHNLKAYAISRSSAEPLEIEVRAEKYMEPISRFAVALESETARVTHPEGVLVYSGKAGPIKNDKGTDCYIYLLGIDRPTTPGYPFRITISDEAPISLQGVFHAVGEKTLAKVPITVVLPNDVFHFGKDVEVELDKVLRPGISPEEQLRELEKAMAGIRLVRG